MNTQQQQQLQPIVEEFGAGAGVYYGSLQAAAAGRPVLINDSSSTFANTGGGGGGGLQYAVVATGGSLASSSSVSSSSSSSLSPSSTTLLNRPLQIINSSSASQNLQQYQTTTTSSNHQTMMFSPQPPQTATAVSLVYLGGGGGVQSAHHQNSFSIGSVSSICSQSSNQSNLDFEDEQHAADSYQDSNSDRLSHMSIKERRQSLNRKLAQRPPKKELVDLGILPSSRVPPLHYDQARHLEKAQIHDILKTKIERRPKRELLVQKNILPDSKAAPSLQLKCNELKRARLADDLNEKLAKRPGPLELVESGILVSSDRNFTDAIKDGKIAYPRTSDCSSFLYHGSGGGKTPFNPPDDAFLSTFNFNFSLTDNDESNASSQASTSTNQTNSSSITSFSSSSLTFGAGQQASVNNNNNNNYATGLFQSQSQAVSSSSNAPSPASSISTNATLGHHSTANAAKFTSSSPSPSSNTATLTTGQASSSWDFVRSGPLLPTTSASTATVHHHHRTSKPKAFKSYSSASSTSSSSKAGGQNGPSKKVSQLIMHEYNGPNQKSSKSVLSLSSGGSHFKSKSGASSKRHDHAKTTSSSSTPTNRGSSASTSAANTTNSVNSAHQNTTTTNSQQSAGLAEFLFDGSNDSSSPMTLPNEDNDNDEPLDPYEIRLKQQQMFLEHDRTPTNNQDNASQTAAFIIQPDHNQNGGVISFTGGDGPNEANQNIHENGNNNQSSVELELNLNDFMSNLSSSANMLSPDFENTLLGIDINSSGSVNGGHLVSLQEMILNRFETTVAGGVDKNKLEVLDLDQPPATTGQHEQQPSKAAAAASQTNMKRSKSSEKTLPPLSASQSLSPLAKIDEMNITELKDECRRLKIKVTGNKTTLIDRLKTHYAQQQQVNNNSSPTGSSSDEVSPPTSYSSAVTSGEPSPSLSALPQNLANMSMMSFHMEQPQQQQQQQQTLYEFQVSDSSDYNGAGGGVQLSSSLEDHPNLNELISAPSSSSNPAATGLIFEPQSAVAVANENDELKLNTFKTNLSSSSNSEFKAPIPPPPAAAAVAADSLSSTLQMQFENTSELLKKCSSSDIELNMEDIQRIERQVQESMKLIERLKSSKSSAQQQQHHQHQQQQSPMNNKLRQINSMPCNLKDLKAPNMINDDLNGADQFQQHLFSMNVGVVQQHQQMNQNAQFEMMNECIESKIYQMAANQQQQQTNGGYMFHAETTASHQSSVDSSQIPVNRSLKSSVSVKNATSLPSIYSLIDTDDRAATDNNMVAGSMDPAMQQAQVPAPAEFDLNEFDFSDLDISTTPTVVVANDNSSLFRFNEAATTTGVGVNGGGPPVYMQQILSVDGDNNSIYQHQATVDGGHHHHHHQSTSYLMNNLIPLNNIKLLKQQAQLALKNNGHLGIAYSASSSNYVGVAYDNNNGMALHQQQQELQTHLNLNQSDETLSGLYNMKNNGANDGNGNGIINSINGGGGHAAILINDFKMTANANFSLNDEQYIQ